MVVRLLTGLVVATGAGCITSTTTSTTTGPLVADVRVEGAALAVRTCAIALEVTDSESFLDVLSKNSHGSHSEETSVYDCETELQQLPPGIEAGPEELPPMLAPPAPAAPLPGMKERPEVRLTREARDSASVNDCGMVARLGATVKAIAPGYYASTFVTDPVIARCR